MSGNLYNLRKTFALTQHFWFKMLKILNSKANISFSRPQALSIYLSLSLSFSLSLSLYLPPVLFLSFFFKNHWYDVALRPKCSSPTDPVHPSRPHPQPIIFANKSAPAARNNGVSSSGLSTDGGRERERERERERGRGERARRNKCD